MSEMDRKVCLYSFDYRHMLQSTSYLFRLYTTLTWLRELSALT